MNTKPIFFDVIFEKHYQERILKDRRLHELYKEAIGMFLNNPQHPQLADHALKGAMHTMRAFSVDDDCRVIYVEDEDKILFLDIGTHKQVYS